MIGVVCDAELVKLTRMGSLDMQAPESGALALLKKLRGSSKPSSETGEKKNANVTPVTKNIKIYSRQSSRLEGLVFGDAILVRGY
jgi:magnesium chelatase subunit H